MSRAGRRHRPGGRRRPHGRTATVHPPSGRSARLVDRRPDPGHDPRAPAGMAVAVVPAVDRGPGQTDAAERDVMDGEADMVGRHDPTVTACRAAACAAAARGRTIVRRGGPCAEGRMADRERRERPCLRPRADIDDRGGRWRALRPRTGWSTTRSRASGSAVTRTSGPSPTTTRRPPGDRSQPGRRQRGQLGRVAELHVRTGRRQRRHLVERGPARYPDGSTWYVASLFDSSMD